MVRLALLAAVAGLGSCQSKKEPPAQPPRDAAVVEVDWAGCEAALRHAPSLAATRRAMFLLESCQPCGDWTPLLRWRTLPGEGGPTHAAIEARMAACGYCEPNARQRFLGALDDARGTQSRAPWRVLGEVCGARTSAVPDTRFMSAPYYALDRLARAIAARPALAPLLDAIDLPLPAVSVTGSGYDLPTASVTAPIAGPAQITITLTDLRTSMLPHGKLTANGIAVTGDSYPGALFDPAKPPAGPIALIAPSGLPASRIAAVVDQLMGRELYLAVLGQGSPEGWIVPGTIPVQLEHYMSLDRPRTIPLDASADPAIRDLKANPVVGMVVIEIGPAATATTLAKLLGAIAFQGAKAVMLTTKP